MTITYSQGNAQILAKLDNSSDPVVTEDLGILAKLDNSSDPQLVDVSDSAARILGIVEIHQPSTKETFLNAFDPQSVVTIVWTNTGVATNVTPDTDTDIDVQQARSIAVQVDTTHASNTSTSFDVNVMATLDGTTWDTVPYAEVNLGDAEVKTFLVAPGVKTIRLRGDQNTAAATGYVTAKVLVRS